MKIRYATIEDVEMLAKIGAETFWDTYHTDSHLEQEYIKQHIAKTFNPRVISKELDDEHIIYLLAEDETEELGYVRLLPGNSRKQVSGINPIEISRIYLRKKFWGKKLGAELISRCFEEGLEFGCDVIWLSVWEHNPRAIKFYKKFGFKIVGDHIFDLAGSSETDFLMERLI